MIDLFFDSYFQIFVQNSSYGVITDDKLMYARVDRLAKSYQHFINKYCGGDKNVILSSLKEYADCFREIFDPTCCERSIPATYGIERLNVLIFGLKNTTMIPYVLYLAKNVTNQNEFNQMYVEEKNRSWCSSSNANDQRAITIECASDTTEPYVFRDIVYQTLIKLCVDICKRNGKTKLIWFGDKDKTLNYTPKSGEMILTVHRWFANKSCPGNWMYARMGDLAAKVTAALGSGTDGKDGKDGTTTSQGTQASAFSGLSEADVVKNVGALFMTDQKKTGILASVSMAQFILESGYGKSELAQNANNVFGMKCSLSGNTWSGSTWDGKSKYTKQTKEQNSDGSYETITANFRKYPCMEDSIADHSAYLLGAKNGSKLRYDGLKDCTDYKKAAQLIKDGGYATSLTYVDNLCSIIERWNLTQFDVKESETAVAWYRVRKTWADSKSQLGAFKVLANAKECADANPGYSVFDVNGVTSTHRKQHLPCRSS